MITAARPLSPEEQHLVLFAFRHPRGRYATERAGQLSGVPARTLYDWAKEDVLTPDYPGRPMAWSYRDLAFVRLLAWLRQGGMERRTAARRVAHIREVMADSSEQIGEIRSDGTIVLLGEETVDRLTGQQVFDSMAPLLSAFNLLEPVAELGRRHLWGPDLLQPTERTAISPWVMGGEPCVRATRIPTADLHALRHERGLGTERIVALYPALDAAQVEDAIRLEERLWQAA
jgi:uncharacterized protein (DUF433 family)